jgi:SAM-dependent methyltransferase
MSGTLRYEFGENWKSFVHRALDHERVARAIASLRRILGVEHLDGKVFLDVGCGSGLFSLAAAQLGAARIIAFDSDPQSIEASRAVRASARVSPDRWQIREGSILDSAFLSEISSADVVYAWGVLHHTGALWRALDRAAGKVAPEGSLALAIYNRQDRLIGGSTMWWHVKRLYNRSPAPLRRMMEAVHVGALAGRELTRGRWPFRMRREYTGDDARGMEFWHDVRDWLGGFPYEYASVEEVTRYLEGRHRFVPEYVNPTRGYGCNEFRFRRPSAARQPDPSASGAGTQRSGSPSRRGT